MELRKDDFVNEEVWEYLCSDLDVDSNEIYSIGVTVDDYDLIEDVEGDDE